MRYILQIFTGSGDTPQYTAEEIIARLETLTARLTVDKVILGWCPCRALYKEVGAYLAAKQIDMVLWLPVFSETERFFPVREAVDAWGRKVTVPITQEGENFSFSCISDTAHIPQLIQWYDTAFADCGFTGVFLDRIRTQSFVGGVSGVLSCGCESCRAAYAAHGVVLSEMTAAYEAMGDRFFDTSGYRGVAGFAMVQSEAARFLEAKCRLITAQVARLSEAFHQKGLQVGMDLYAPLMSGFVGQSYEALAPYADFIKPMLYRRTEAPAGILYEYACLRDSAPAASGYPLLTAEEALLKGQLEGLAALPTAVYPGIEVNYREDIARTDEAYIRESMRVLEDGGVAGATLSWDVMMAPPSHLECL